MKSNRNPRRPSLRVAVIGGGPGGLYLARLLRMRVPTSHVEVFERNAAKATFGFGVAFSQRTLENLHDADAQTHDAIIGASLGWEGMMIRHDGRCLRWPGFGLDAIGRTTLLEILGEAAVASGAVLHTGHEVHVDDLSEYEVVIAADGANSLTRSARADAFGFSSRLGRSKYMWLGSTGPFDVTTFCIRTNKHGTFAIHAYPYARGRATLVAEADEATWRRAGLDRSAAQAQAPGQSDVASADVLAEVFAEDLAGHEILLNNSKWLNFSTVSNERWWTGNVVLLGDAAHTAHPSVASGTKLAMEDAIVLADELASTDDLPAAFSRYEARRRPDVEHVQRRAELSQRWWETLRLRAGLPTEQLAISYLTRAGAVNLRGLDDSAPALTLRALAELAPATGGEGGSPSMRALSMPIDIGGVRLTGRLLRTDANAAATGAIQIVAGESAQPDAAIAAVEAARAAGETGVLGVDLPSNGIEELDTLVDLAARLRSAGCDVIALRGGEPGGTSELSEAIRLRAEVATLERTRPDELASAAARILAGRVDLIELLDGEPDGSCERRLAPADATAVRNNGRE